MGYARKLTAGRFCEIHLYDVASASDKIIYRSDALLLEAPNWHKAGHLILNGDGKLWSLDCEIDSTPKQISIDGVPELNNDHVLSSDSKTIYMSAYGDWQIYKAPAAGGAATRITPATENTMYFLHGVTSDESELAYVNIRTDAKVPFSSGRIHLYNQATGEDRILVGGSGPEDGSEYSADNQWVYFNTEHFSAGQAQIARARRDGSGLEQLTFDERVNWFPHQSLTGNYWVYLSYPAGTQGHPADLPVELRLIRGEDWSRPEIVTSLEGGQGTINVNSWNPNQDQFAYVTYPESQ